MYPTPSDSQPGNPLPSAPARGFTPGASRPAIPTVSQLAQTAADYGNEGPRTPMQPVAPAAAVNGAQVTPATAQPAAMPPAAQPAPDTPQARGFTQVATDAFRQGNGYTDRAGVMGTGIQMGAPAAGLPAMGENQQALARLQAANATQAQTPVAAPRGFDPNRAAAALNDLRSPQYIALRNAAVGGITRSGYNALFKELTEGARTAQTEEMKDAGQTQRAAMQEAGATGRTAMTEGGAMVRAGMTNDVQQGELGLKREAQGFTTRAAGRLEQAQQDYLNAKTPQERAQAAQSLRVLTGKDEQPTAPSGYRWAGANLQAIPGGPGDKTQQGKPMPTAAASGLLGNRENLRRAENALGLLNGEQLPGGATGDPNATGIKGYMPNQLLNRLDPKGVDTRAAIADLGSLIIHDRSGAAVTAAEFPRLAPFIPTEKDDPATARKKLEQFAKNYRATIDDTAEFYRQLGYNVPDDRQDQPQAQQPGKPQPQQPTGQPQPAQIPQAGEVRQGYRFRGGDPADRNAWEVAQ
jgi:hypothetical protein